VRPRCRTCSALPPGIKLEIDDRTTTIRASVADVQGTLLLAMVLVVAVIFLFLRSWRATVIPAWRCRCR
jgi:multidrug efflux pump subunit AcrB